MTPTGVAARVRRLPAPVRWLAVAVAVEALLLAVHFGATSARVRTLRYAVYPFVWINAAVIAVAARRPPRAPRPQRVAVGVVAAGYFVGLAYLAGLLGVPDPYVPRGLWLGMGSPGWAPRVTYVGPWVYAIFVPFRVIGYLALSYLAYAAALDALANAAGGLLGFVTCLGCAFPVVSAVVAGTLGGAAAATVASFALDVSTATFLLAVAVLYWLPR